MKRTHNPRVNSPATSHHQPPSSLQHLTHQPVDKYFLSVMSPALCWTLLGFKRKWHVPCPQGAHSLAGDSTHTHTHTHIHTHMRTHGKPECKAACAPKGETELTQGPFRERGWRSWWRSGFGEDGGGAHFTAIPGKAEAATAHEGCVVRLEGGELTIRREAPSLRLPPGRPRIRANGSFWSAERLLFL